MIKPLMHFPAPATDEHSDFVLMAGSGDPCAPHILVYEVIRDFLSAPRSFAIVEITSATSGAIELAADNEYEGIAYHEDGSMSELGFFVLQEDVLLDDEGAEDHEVPSEQHILISLAAQRIELLAESVTFKQSLIAASAREALGLYLTS